MTELTIPTLVLELVFMVATLAVAWGVFKEKIRSLEEKTKLLDIKMEQHLRESPAIQRMLTELQVEMRHLREDIKELKKAG